METQATISRRRMLEIVAAEEAAKSKEMQAAVKDYLDLTDQIQAAIEAGHVSGVTLMLGFHAELSKALLLATEAWRQAARRHWDLVRGVN